MRVRFLLQLLKLEVECSSGVKGSDATKQVGGHLIFIGLRHPVIDMQEAL